MGWITTDKDKIKAQKEADMELAKYQQGLDLETWHETFNAENDYNTPAAQLARAREAGINPNLVIGSLSSEGGSGVVGNAGASVSPVDSRGAALGAANGALGNMMSALEQSQLIQAQKQNIQADTQQKLANAANTNKNTSWVDRINATNVQKILADTDLTKEQRGYTKKLLEQVELLTEKQKATLFPEVASAYASYTNLLKTGAFIEEQTKAAKASADKDRTTAALNQQQASESAERTIAQQLSNFEKKLSLEYKKILSSYGLPTEHIPMKTVRLKRTENGFVEVGAKASAHADAKIGVLGSGASAGVSGELSGKAGASEGSEDIYEIQVPLGMQELDLLYNKAKRDSTSPVNSAPNLPPYVYQGSSFVPAWNP